MHEVIKNQFKFLYTPSIKAKAHSLSEKEVEEFFNGNPELVDPSGELDSELFHFIPYDKQYEVDLEELNIGMTHSAVLIMLS
jgi:hypothetical protein